MKIRLFTCTTLGALLLGSTVHVMAQTVPDAATAQNLLTQAGYVAVGKLEQRQGVWTASVTNTAGERVSAYVDVMSGAITSFNVRNPAQRENSLFTLYHTLSSQGYSNFRDIEYDDGLWEAEALNGQRQWVDLVVHPVTGVILSERPDNDHNDNNQPGNAILNAEQIIATLQAAGYTRIHDLEFDDGLWEAEALNRVNQRVELEIDPKTGAVIREKIDD